MKPAGTLWSLAGVPLLFAAISVPLALQMVEPNPFYGVRIPATQASEVAWYRANQAAGIAGLAGGIVGFVANLRILRSNRAEGRKVGLCLAVLLGIAALLAVAGVAAA